MEAVARPQKVIDSVYAAIRDSICDGDLKPGERIRQDEIADRLGVSRQPVGQALILLKAEGFVSDTGRRGVTVAGLDAGTVRDIYGIRGALDALAAGLAAADHRTEDLGRGRAILAEGRTALASGASVATLVKLDMRFHEFIYELSGNVLIRQTLASHWHHLRRVMAGVVEAGLYRQKLWDEHEDILGAVAARDADTARALSVRHVEVASQALQEKIGSAA